MVTCGNSNILTKERIDITMAPKVINFIGRIILIGKMDISEQDKQIRINQLLNEVNK